jgi:hypothetical protein
MTDLQVFGAVITAILIFGFSQVVRVLGKIRQAIENTTEAVNSIPSSLDEHRKRQEKRIEELTKYGLDIS